RSRRTGAIDIGMGGKRSAIALVAETPDRAGFGGLEVRQTDQRAGVDEIGDRVETLDGETRVAVHDHPLRRRGLGGEWRGGLRGQALPQKEKRYSPAKILFRAESGF